MKLTIVIPNYNGKELLKKTLGRVLKEAQGDEVIIVDDASTDGSVALIRSEFAGIRVIEKGKNEGFASSVNIGVEHASGDLVFLLNSDAYPVKGYKDYALPYFQDPTVFAVGLAQKCTEEGKEIIRGRGLGTFQKGFLIHRHAQPNENNTLWVSGGAGVFRKSIWIVLGGMDTLYNPFYWEDIDLSYRAQKAGYKVFFEPRSIVVHSQSVGSIRTSYSASQIKTIAYRNQFFFVWLNITDAVYLLQHFIYLPYHILTSLLSKEYEMVKGFAQALMMLQSVLMKNSNHKKTFNTSDREVLLYTEK